MVNGNIDQFLAEMGRIPLLTAAEEITLGTAVQLGKSLEATPRQQRAGQRAKERMIKANIRLVVNVSRKYMHRQMGQLESGDLIQEGCIGVQASSRSGGFGVRKDGTLPHLQSREATSE